MNSFLRPNRSVSQPKNSAPTQAPATYRAAPTPVTWLSEMCSPLPGSESRLAMFPTTVTSRPSRIQTVPRPITIIQCHRDQGSRSSLAGTLVVIVPIGASPELLLIVSLPPGGSPVFQCDRLSTERAGC